MARLLWLPDVLRDAGLKIIVMPGAETRGRSDFIVNGIVWHSTVTPEGMSDQRVAELLRDGHSTLAGPLSQLGPARNGTIYIPALGKCNHNGYGLWKNDSIGIEFFNDGYAPFPGPQMEAGIIATAAMLKYLGKRTEAVKAHKETDPRRKIDPSGVNMNQVREKILARLDSRPVPAPPAPPAPTEEFTVAQYDDLMAAISKATMHAIDAANRAKEAEAGVKLLLGQTVPEGTVREGLRNVKRAALAAGAVGVEGVTDDVRQPRLNA